MLPTFGGTDHTRECIPVLAFGPGIAPRPAFGPVAPLFRFPYLSDPRAVRDYLGRRDVAVVGIDVDSPQRRPKPLLP